MKNEIKTKEKESANEISLVAMGDVFVSGVIVKTDGRVEDNRRDNPNEIFDLVAPFLGGKDIVFCNLEGPLCRQDTGRPIPYKRAAWSSDPKNVSALKYGNINIVSLANNQSIGYGPEGLMKTFETLKSNGIDYVGAGANIEEARRPKIISRKNTKIGFVSYFTNHLTPGYAALRVGAGEALPGIADMTVSPLYDTPHQIKERDFELFEEDVKKARSMSDVLIVGCHMGHQGQTLTHHQKAIARKAIDCGADLLIGTHPHQMQGIEIYKKKAIFYSVGNFALDYNYATGPKESIIVDCIISNKAIQKITLRPILLHQGEKKQTKILMEATKDGERVFGMLNKLSQKLGTTLSYKNGEIKLPISN